MTETRRTLRYFLDGGFYDLAWTEWGKPDAEPVLCVHGLTRNGRDFDYLAERLSRRFRVLCPDLPGRGASSWLPRGELYTPQNYITALSHLLARLDAPIRWVGTSLGGILGMMIAAFSGNSIDRLVLNDIGPFIPLAALARIRDYIGECPEFADLGEAEAYLRRVHAPFGRLTDAQWAALTRNSVREAAGGLRLHYDPRISAPMRAAAPADMDLSAIWAGIRVPVLALRGAESDLLLPETFQSMGAKAALHTVPDAGHAPALMDAESVAVIEGFLA